MEENQPKAQRSNAFLAGSIIVAALIVGGALVYNSGATSLRGSTGTSNVTQSVGGSVSAPSIDDDVILGDPNAPVTLITFGDYQCPVCERMYQTVEKQLRKEYIETGKMRMVFRDFPLDQPDPTGYVLHPYARGAAEAAQCAKDQGKYWAYHDALYDRQAQLPTLNFVALAGELGLDTKQFGTCVSEKKYAAEVEKDFQDGIAAGVNGTPGNFVNGKSLPGLYPYETFKSAIEEALKNAPKP